MKYSRSAITQLTRWYKQVLIKCAILNAVVVTVSFSTPALASEISGFSQTSGTYNIEAEKISGSTGFRQYEKFTLSDGDVANLQFKKGETNYDKFVNMVDNQVNINGIVNTVKGDIFYDGHAIFVSPNGMVVGASGVLNVGALTVATPNQSTYNTMKSAYNGNTLSDYEVGKDKYKEVLTNSQGDVIINGKIISKGDVEIYGKNITVSGTSADKAGIVAGVSEQEKLTSKAKAKEVFDSLVSNNITNATDFSLQGGKIKIVAGAKSGFADAAGDVKVKVDVKNANLGAEEVDISAKAEIDRQEHIDLAEAKINVEDSTIAADSVSLSAEATQNKELNVSDVAAMATFIGDIFVDIFDGDAPSVTSLWGVAGKASADVTVKNSIINAVSDVEIGATASSSTEENANFLTPTIIDFIAKDDAHISEFFSSGIYSGFEGAKSSAVVTVDNSTINAGGKIDISADATSSLDANNRILGYMLPIGIYGVGTETVAKAIVKNNSKLKATGDVGVAAVSENENSVTIANDSLLSITMEDGYLAAILNNTVKTETEASITDSTVEANNLDVFAGNLTENETDVEMLTRAGLTGEGQVDSQGNSSVSIAGVLNRSNNNVKALIKNSTVETKKDATVLAQSLISSSNSADATVDDQMVKKPKTFDQTVKDKLKEIQFKYTNVNIFNKIKGRTAVKANQSATLEAGGVFVWNDTNNTTTAKIENSTVTAQDGDVTVQANTVDLLSNAATTDTQGEEKVGLGLSVIYTEQHNTTNANIDSSTVEANDVTVDATTELPMNQGKLTFGFNLPFSIAGVEKIQFGGKFASEANGKWSVSPVYPKSDSEAPKFEVTGLAEQNIRDTYSGLKPKFRLSGFFNNLAQTNSVGANASVSASVVYNEVVNNTTADITNGSDITANDGDVVVNAVNSVIGYQAAGLVDILITQINYKIPGQEDWGYEPTVDGGKFGLGANFIWNNYTNNATAKIDGSTITAQKGNVDVDAATEQSFMTIVMTGGKSETLGIDGSIHVQKLKGDTIAQISNISGNDSVEAKKISVEAGKAHIKTTAGNISRDNETNQIEWKKQNEDAEGDEKYIREAKDEITNIIVQGAWTSQYEEVDNTVQTNSGGVAVGASVDVTDIDRTVKAVVENTAMTADEITVETDTYNQTLNVEVAAAFSGGVTQKESEVENVQQNADNAQDDEDNIFGNLFDGEDEYMRNPVGNDLADLQSQFSMSIAGAATVMTDATKAEAAINNSTLTVKDKLNVNASREAKLLSIGGGLGKTKKVGAGAAVNIYKQEGSVKSYIDGATINFSGSTPQVDVKANNKTQILNIAIGAGVATNSDAENKGFQAAIGGSASVNTLKPVIEAYINDSTIKMATNKTGKIDVKIDAKNDVDIYNIAGGGSLAYGGSSGISAGAAFNYNNIKNTISAYIQNSTLSDIGALTVSADADNNLNDFAIAGAIVAGSDDGFTFSFAGAADVDYVHDTITAKIAKSTITASNDVEVKAHTNSDNLAVAGTFDVSTADNGAGVNGDVVVNIYRNTVTAEIDKDSVITKANDVKSAATSTEKSNVITAGLSVGSGGNFLMAAANVGVNIIDNTVKSIVEAAIENANNVNVAAYDEATLYSRGGTLAAASADTVLNIAGAFNIDILDKTVEAKIKDSSINATGDVSVTATSINSMGGTKNDDNEYSRDDVTTDAYKEKMLNKNADGEYVGLKQDSDFGNWNMFYDVAVGSEVSVSGAGIVKAIQNTVTAEVINSDITADNLSILANDYSIKNIIAGAVSASSEGAVGAQVLYTKDNSTTSALISGGSKLTIGDTIDLAALNRKDNHQIVVAGSGAGTASGNLNLILNNIKDNAIAKIDNSSSTKEIKASTLTVNANEDMNASHIVVTGSGAGNVAINISPMINGYNGTVEASINNATVKDAAINVNAENNIETLDISVGVSGVGQGLGGVGVAIKNNYTNTVKALINNAVIDTSKTVAINGNSIIDANNWIGAVAVAGQGVSLVVDVLLNNVLSTVEAGIKDSDIQKAGNIAINTNKNKQDIIKNHAIGFGFTGEGATALVNTVQNIYDNTVKAYVDNTSVSDAISLALMSNSDRYLDNLNIGVSGAAIGASLMANVLVNQIDSATHSYVDAKSKNMNIKNSLSVEAKDNNEAANSMGYVNIAGLGAAAGANINLYYADNLAKAEALSAANGRIIAGSSAVNSTVKNGLDNLNVNVSGGAGSIAGDVAIIKLGKRTETYTDTEKEGKIKVAVDYTKNQYDEITANDEIKGKYTPTSSSSGLKTGSIASVNANLHTTNKNEIKAKSQLKGLGNKEKLELTNTNVSAGIGTVGVAVKDVQLASNTVAEIIGGTVESANDSVTIAAESKADIDITNVKVEVAGLRVSGGGAVYNNTSETVAQIVDATVNAKKDITVEAISNNHSTLDSTNVVVTGGTVFAIDLAELKDTNRSIALISGNTNIDAKGKLTLHSKTNTDLNSTKATVTVAGANMVDISKNEVNAGTISRAIIENVNGTINVGNLDIITDYDVMSAYSKANVTAVKLGDVYSGDSSGAFMNADIKSGIDSPYGLKLNNTGTTNIITARDNGNEQKGIVAKAEINNVHVSLQGFVANTSAKSENNAKVTTVLKSNDFTTNALNMNSYLNSSVVSNAGAVKATVGIGVNVVNVDAKDVSDMNVEISGKNTITGNAVVNAIHKSFVNSDLSAFNFGGLVGGGQRIRIKSELTADTTGNISGDFNAGSANISFDTTRNSIMSKSSGSGSGIVNVNDTGATNNLSGSSILTISGLTTDKEKANNNLSVKNKSTNTMDMTSSDGSGGIINVSDNDTTSTFTSSTTTKVLNSKINSENTVGFETENKTVVKDTASMGFGGFIAVTSNDVTNSYTSDANLLIENSEINADTVKLTAKSDIRNAKGDWVDYTGAGGGFVAKNVLELTNNLTQTNKIDIKGSKLNAGNNLAINFMTSSEFKQRTDSTAGGFVAIPRSKNWLNVNNTNTLNVDTTSKLLAANELEINFNSNNSVAARATSEAHHFGFKDPVSESYIDLKINNNLNNSGSLEAGKKVDIDFMSGSTNNLEQYAYSEAHAAIPTTTEDGKSDKTVNNNFNLEAGAKVISGKDINVKYSSGGGSNKSTVAWKTVCYALFGIPISNSDSKDKSHNYSNNSLALKGEMIAGQGNNRYMKINRDGTIDHSVTTGFANTDYQLYDGTARDGAAAKAKTIASINIEIADVNSQLEFVGTDIEAYSAMISDLTEYHTFLEGISDYLIDKINNKGYVIKSLDDIRTVVENKMKADIVNGGISEEMYGAILSAYAAKRLAVEVINQEKTSDFVEMPSIVDFLNVTSYDMSAAQIAEFVANYNPEDNTISALPENVSQEVADAALAAYKAKCDEVPEGGEKPDLTEFLSANKYGLTAEQINIFGTALENADNALIEETVEGVKFYTYVEGNTKYLQAPVDDIEDINSYFQEVFEDLQKQIANFTKLKEEIEQRQTILANKKSSLENSLAEATAKSEEDYAVLSDEPYSIAFDNLRANSSLVSIAGIYNTNISGAGNINVATPGFKIDNYSTRKIILNDIDLGSSTTSGLVISNWRGTYNYNEFQNKEPAVNTTDAVDYVSGSGNKSFDQLSTNGVHYKDLGAGADGVTINNYYDVSNPFAETLDIPNNTARSDVIFNGRVNTDNQLNVLNESGNIILNGDLDVNTTKLFATQGRVEFNKADSTLSLGENGKIFAGKGVKITADKVDIKGDISAGYTNRNLTITSEMLQNLVIDPTTGEQNMIDLNAGNPSVYMNATNNIKAIYKNGEIYLFKIGETSGDISITTQHGGTITGKLTMADGYQTITVNNQTDKVLNISDITNTKQAGGLTASDDVTASDKTTNTVAKAETSVISTGKVISGGVIKNSFDGETADKNGSLSITANNGLVINKPELFNAITAGGNVNLTNNGGQMNVIGNIVDTGNINITNNGESGVVLSGNITENGGDITVSNTKGNLELNSKIEFSENANGLLTITNSANAGKMTVNEDINNKSAGKTVNNIRKSVVMTNNSASGLAIKHNITAAQGDVEIANTGGKLSIEGNITDTLGDVIINNSGTDGLEYLGTIDNKSGNVQIANTKGDAEISGPISNKGGNTSIANENGALTVASKVENTGGNLSVANTGNGTTVSGDLDNTGGKVLISNTGKDLTLTADSTVDNNATGDVEITNSGNGKLVMSGAVSNKVSGNTTVTNTGASGAEITGTITNANGNTAIDNKNGLTLAATLSNTGGDTTITNTGDAEISGPISNKGGNTSIANESGALTLASKVENSGGNLSVINTGTGTTISGDLDNTGGKVLITNSGKDLTLTTDSTVDNNGAGNVEIANSGDGKLVMSGAVSNKVSGDTTVTNTGSKGAEITGTITNTQGNLAIQNQNSDLVFAQDSVIQNLTSGDMKIENATEAGLLAIAGNLDNAGNGNIIADNKGAGEFAIAPSGNIHAAKGNIDLSNSNDGGLQIAGQVVDDNGDTIIDNTSKDGMTVATTGQIIGKTGNIELNNNGAAGLIIDGKVLAEKQNITINNQNSDLIIGELDTANDNYVEATSGNVMITQTNGDVLNGITDKSGNKHQNADFGNPQQSYKTLIATGGDLEMKVTDGDIGYTDNTAPGFSIDAATRDWTDSVNIKVDGDVTAIAANNNNSDIRLINLRAKDSDLNIKSIKADGNVILTAADWKQADARPTPDDEAYFKGYSVLNTTGDDNTTVIGRNISIIASDNIGSADKKLKYMQDTATDPNTSVSFEAENDLYITGSANSAHDTKIYQIISKRGAIDMDLESNATIGFITAGDGLVITQKAQNLTIGEVGLSPSDDSTTFKDILYPHDGLIYGDDEPSDVVVPKYVMISVLDAMDTPERSDSNLKIYSLYVRGNNGDNDNYYPDGGRLADVTLMADNIYANSDKAPDSNVSTKANPEGYKQTDTTYSDEIFGGNGDVHTAKGINAYGEGSALSFDIIGVDKDIVADTVANPQRDGYKEQTSVKNIPSKFRNSQDSIYDYDFRVKNTVISVNDYADNERGVEFDTLYADDAYVNTLDTNLTIHDGYINNYAELRNGNRDADSNRFLVIVDNDYRRLIPSNVQLYTQKTGSFALTMSDLIKFKSPAPVTHYDWYKLVNTFDDENSFVRLGLKETELRQHAKDYYTYGNVYVMPQSPVAEYAVWRDSGIVSNVKIMDISRKGAVIVNRDNWQVGDEQAIELSIDGLTAKIKCVVTKIERNLATVKFINMPASIANKIAYRYMKTAENN